MIIVTTTMNSPEHNHRALREGELLQGDALCCLFSTNQGEALTSLTLEVGQQVLSPHLRQGRLFKNCKGATISKEFHAYL